MYASCGKNLRVSFSDTVYIDVGLRLNVMIAYIRICRRPNPICLVRTAKTKIMARNANNNKNSSVIARTQRNIRYMT